MDTGNVMKLGLQLLLFSLILIFLVYPFILSAANRLINRFWSPYWRTVGAIIVTAIVGGIVGFIVLKTTGQRDTWMTRVVSFIIMVVIGGALFKAFVHHKDGSPLSYGRAVLPYLVLAIVSVLITFAVAPWQRGVAAKMKGNLPNPAATASVAAPGSAPAAASSVVAARPEPAATQSAAPAASAPAKATTTH